MIGIIVDEWKNDKKKSIYNFLLKAPFKRPVYYRSIDMTFERKESSNISKHIYKAISDIVPHTRFVTVTTDNAPNVLNIAGSLCEQFDMNTIGFGCLSHVFNLLFEHLLNDVPLLKEITKTIKTTIEEIENRTVNIIAFDRVLKRNNKTGLVFPRFIIHRWSTNIRIYRLFDVNSTIIKEFSIQEEVDISEGIVLGDENFWSNLTRILELLETIYKGLIYSQRDSCSMNDMFKIIFSIRKGIYLFAEGRVDGNMVIKAFTDVSRHIKLDIINASNMLDVHERGALLDSEEIDKSISIITKLSNYSPQIIGELHKWRHKEALEVSSDFTWNISSETTSLAWFEYFGKYIPNLYKAFLKLNSIAVSSSSVERSFAIQSFIHNKHRLKLKEENVYYLINIKFNKFILEDGLSAESINEEQDLDDLIDINE